nr:MAG TPA: hypothetical protein [Caudoviricetes sp.]
MFCPVLLYRLIYFTIFLPILQAYQRRKFTVTALINLQE